MTGVDIAVLLIIGVSGLLSWMRGITRETVSLASWGFAVSIPLLYAHKFAVLLPASIQGELPRIVVSVLILFFGILFIGWAIGSLVKQLLTTIKLSPVDRILGLLFGLTRGVLIIALIVLGLNLTEMPQDTWWNESFFLTKFQHIARWLYDYLPDNLASYFSFSDN